MIITSFASCGSDNSNDDQTDDQSTSDITTENETTVEEVTEEETTVAEDTTEETVEETTEETTEEVEETTAEFDEGVYSRLTGLPTTAEIYGQRPVGVMINNLKKSWPQWGLSEAGIIYECMVEGFVTRLYAIFDDMPSKGVIGSVRSAREYFMDFAANHNALFVHAGGSAEAYSQIKIRNINNLDFVNMYDLNKYWYRDADRRQNMGYEHSLMTTGELISAAIEYKGYNTEMSESFESSFKFYDYASGETKDMSDAGSAAHVVVKYHSVHSPEFIYNPETDTYTRTQYTGIVHVDAKTEEPLEFTNVLLLSLVHKDLNDELLHISVDSTGSGEGYYITGGKYVKIRWEKATQDTPMKLYCEDGTPLVMNCGKTFVNIVSPTVFKRCELDKK
jgi:hypothetical protein